MPYKRQKRKRTQIGRGRKKKLVKALVKRVGLPLLHTKMGSRKFKLPILPYHFRVKKQGNSYGLHGGMTFHLPFYSKTIEKKVL